MTVATSSASRASGRADIAQLTVQGTNLQGIYQDLNDDDQDGDTTEFLDFTPQPTVVDNYIAINPTTDEQRENLFRSSFAFVTRPERSQCRRRTSRNRTTCGQPQPG